MAFALPSPMGALYDLSYALTAPIRVLTAYYNIKENIVAMGNGTEQVSDYKVKVPFKDTKPRAYVDFKAAYQVTLRGVKGSSVETRTLAKGQTWHIENGTKEQGNQAGDITVEQTKPTGGRPGATAKGFPSPEAILPVSLTAPSGPALSNRPFRGGI